ncbi:hypothetical protein KR018_006411 [Drosophila ironensis]|nr:hypothetical protein KR018_006411 [Drosophila ironensis]
MSACSFFHKFVMFATSSYFVLANWGQYSYPAWPRVAPPMVSVDHFGNCQAHDRPLVGRCVRYAECISAVQSAHRVTPLFCPSTWPEPLVCCPHGGYVTQAPRVSKSEEACSRAYPRSHHKRRRRRNSGDHSHHHAHHHAQVEALEPIIQKRNQSSMHVVGGRITQPLEHPYMCALGWPSRRQKWMRGHGEGVAVRRYSFQCGCVLIAPRFALTAAHCANIGGESPTVALIGGVDLNNSHGQLIEIKHLTKHPDFHPEAMSNDLAIVELGRSSQYMPACLWGQETVPQQPLTALGYGQTKFAGPHSNELLQVLLYPLDNTRCQAFMHNAEKLVRGLEAGQMCAGDYSGRMDTCQGDSGGPLLIHQHMRHHHHRIPYLVGITSFGGACGTGEPGIYVRIAHYIPWIEQQVWP